MSFLQRFNGAESENAILFALTSWDNEQEIIELYAGADECIVRPVARTYSGQMRVAALVAAFADRHLVAAKSATPRQP